MSHLTARVIRVLQDDRPYELRDSEGKAVSLGYGQIFDGVDDNINCGAATSLNIGDVVTVEFWIKMPTVTPGTSPISKNIGDSRFSWFFTIDGQQKLCFTVGDDNLTTNIAYSDTAMSADTWYHVAGTVGGNVQKMYINGIQQMNTPTPNGIYSQPTWPVRIGRAWVGTEFAGTADEVRISAVARSADWVATEYNNQNSPATFHSVGGEETIPAAWYDSSWAYRRELTIDHTRVTSYLTDFPVLVSLPYDGALASHARPNGKDILFTASDGITKLNHEIEMFNGGTGTLVAWVKVPSLSSSADTRMFMYYANPTAGQTISRSNMQCQVGGLGYLALTFPQLFDMDLSCGGASAVDLRLGIPFGTTPGTYRGVITFTATPN